MIWLKYVFLGLFGFAAGQIISAGVFALITSTGVMTRFADKTHTAKYVRLYETMVILGGVLWNIFWVFSIKIRAPFVFENGLLIIMGLCQGIFVGCLAVSLAETLNATAIFARRAKLKMGLSFIVLSIAIGKLIGCLVQFFLVIK